MDVQYDKQNSVTLTALGDILLHGRVYGGLKKKNNFKFKDQLSGVRNLLGKTDLTVANLETPIAGVEYGLSGFPRFNAPSEIAPVLKDLGIDIVTLANNHILDQGEIGLLKTIENLENAGLIYDGAYKSLKDSETLRVFHINGLKVCFISFTSKLNVSILSLEKKYLVNHLKLTSLLRICKLLRRIKRENIADIIIVNFHFGEEYHLNPSCEQKEIAASLSDAGADVIIGHHPHVLQPPEWIENSKGNRTFVAYSLGNFFSGQNGLYRQIGAVLRIKIRKPDIHYNKVIIENPRYDLTFVNRKERLRYDIYTFKNWMKDNDFIETAEGKFNSFEVYNKIINHLRKNIKDLEVY